MGLMFLNKFSILFLLISGSLLSTSFAGGRSKFMSNLAEDLNETKEGTPNKSVIKEEVSMIHERLLRDNTRDYGRYDPSPSLSKPPFKLIPN
ncbi:hypothetical protein Lal_00019625 [Lupinus albus]|uniref:Uncharacterized protein n=1 Tax=Lupinus albus TaxID=3870 RepID=A0A6A5PN99_LUPAL|nr:hypothetical protein Lalb_Chr01g0007961 [Lupinus albus]KAF1899497.1 hypothetical protein Lal_00019625 [Lupinus albus]